MMETILSTALVHKKKCKYYKNVYVPCSPEDISRFHAVNSFHRPFQRDSVTSIVSQYTWKYRNIDILSNLRCEHRIK